MTKCIPPVLLAAIAYVSVAAASPAKTTIPAGPEIGKPVPQFKAPAIDLSGEKPKTAEFDSHKTKRITAYIFVGTTCPATNAYAERFKQIEQTYRGKNVDFLYIYPNANDTTEAKLAFHKEKQLGGRLIDDKGGHLARLFKALRTSELFLANKRGVIVYHGAVDDARDPNGVKQRYLATALDEVLAGKPVSTTASQVFA